MAQEEMLDRRYVIPLIESTRHNNQFTYTILPINPQDQNNKEWLARFEKYELTYKEAQVLLILRELGAIRTADYRFLYKVDATTATHHLRRLWEMGLIAQKGDDSIICYTATQKFWDLVSSNKEQGRGEVSIGDNALTFIPTAVISSIDRDNVELVVKILKDMKGAGKNRSEATIKEFIKQLCLIQPFTAPHLASIFGKHPRRFRPNFLKPMVEEGELRLKYPDVPSHLSQAYMLNPDLEDS